MPSKLGLYFSTLRHLGFDTIGRSMRHDLHRAYWQQIYSPAQGSGSGPVFLGGLQHHSPISTPDGETAGLDLHCQGGVLRLEFITEGVARVRLSRTGEFAQLFSYAVVNVASLAGGVRMREDGDGSSLIVEGPGLVVRVQSNPCRLTFLDSESRVLCADAGGAGWEDGEVVCQQALPPNEAVYGLGEKAFGLNRRGRRPVMWNTDPKGQYGPGTDPLYQSTPFLAKQRAGIAVGLFFDNTYRAEFDLGQAERETLTYRAAGGELCYYVLAGPGLADVVRRFTWLTGRMPLPPRWALGYHQSRWSYGTEDDVRRIVREFRARRIPCDAVHLDIDYMDGYRVFTWDATAFPDPAALIADLRRQGIRTVAITDPGVKTDHDYHVCAEGLRRDAFCRLPDGSLYTGPVWPGDCYFPDFTDPDVRRWWGDLYKSLLDLGVAGLWNDMNEPAVFLGSTFPDAVQHRSEQGTLDHRALHNVYGQCMVQAAAEGAARHRPDERTLVISRSAYAGIQRYALTWTGDNYSSWEHLRLSIPMVLNMGLSGQAFTGPDVAGFSGNAEGELLVRWIQMGAFMPFFRNHSALGSAVQEPYVFGEPYESICRSYIELRYRLLPYLYTAFWQAAATGLPVVRPLCLPYPGDLRTASLEDQFLCGDALLVAPILEPQSEGRGVYLPVDSKWYDFWTGQPVEGGQDIPAHAPLHVLPLYVRAGSALPFGPVMQYSDELIPQVLELHLFAGDGHSYLYEDDGLSFNYRQGEWRVTRFRAHLRENGLVLTREVEGAFDPGYGGYDVLLRGMPESGSDMEGMEIVVDGMSVTPDVDTEWHVPRIAAGLFKKLEIRRK